MRHVDKYLIVAKFRYENLRAARCQDDIIEENDYFATFDLKSGYYHIPMAKGFARDFTAKQDFLFS